VGSGLTVAESLLATKIAFLVFSGATVVVLASGGIWVALRAFRAALAFARTWILPRLQVAWAGFRFRKLPVSSGAAQLEPSHRVRVQGVVEGASVTRAEFSGVAAVVSRHELGERGGGAVERSFAAHDFDLRLEDGSRVRVMARQAAGRHWLRLLDRKPDRWLGEKGAMGWVCESRVEPGETIEVIGRLSRQVDPTAPRISDRQPALGWMLAADSEPLFLRFWTPSQRLLRPAE
jgi:hypothetical protein